MCKRPPYHLDINMSSNGTNKIGLESGLKPSDFEDILDNRTKCYFLLNEIPSHLATLKAYQYQYHKKQNRHNRKQANK
jgi:hypothetical protein